MWAEKRFNEIFWLGADGWCVRDLAVIMGVYSSRSPIYQEQPLFGGWGGGHSILSRWKETNLVGFSKDIVEEKNVSMSASYDA